MLLEFIKSVYMGVILSVTLPVLSAVETIYLFTF